MRKKVLVFGLALCLVLAMSGEVFAGIPGTLKKTDTSIKGAKVIEKSGIKSLKNKNDSAKTGHAKIGSVRDEYGYVIINSPASNSVFFRGEAISVKFSADDCFDADATGWWAGPFAALANISSGKKYYETDYEAVDAGYMDSYSDTIKITNNFPVGRYVFGVTLYPYDTYYYTDYNLPDDIGDWYLPRAVLYLTIKNLNPPAGLKAKAGKKKVTVTFNSAEGASRYQIFKSTKKNNGYKLLKTTTARKIVDKKVKKGKKYYYKVRTVRSVRGTIVSGFSKTVRSKKVKK
jgi:hypothetical protein